VEIRYLVTAAISGAALFAAVPAVAQMGSPGPVYHNQGPIPAPGARAYAPPAPRYNPPQVRGPATPPRVDVRQQQRPGAPDAGSRVWQNGRWNSLPRSQNVARHSNPNRWRYEHGRWDGGNRAPGGWNSYRRLGRGHRLPQYWLQGSFGIPDYLAFGLAAPPQGYHWSRYYDDAVLVDYQGNVWDSVDGIAWSDDAAYGYADNGYAAAESYGYSSDGYAPRIEPVVPDAYYEQQPYPGGYAPPVAIAPPVVQVQGFQGYGYGSGYAASSYYSAPTTSTSVTYITLPGTTTTTVTEEVVESVSYVRSAPRRKIRRAPVRHYAKPKCCVCVCR
jgi:Ni/Co efflux regulator RcnB